MYVYMKWVSSRLQHVIFPFLLNAYYYTATPTEHSFFRPTPQSASYTTSLLLHAPLIASSPVHVSSSCYLHALQTVMTPVHMVSRGASPYNARYLHRNIFQLENILEQEQCQKFTYKDNNWNLKHVRSQYRFFSLLFCLFSTGLNPLSKSYHGSFITVSLAI